MISRITAMALLLFSSPSNMGHQRILHGVARFERSDNSVGIHRRAPENIIAQSIGQRVQDGGKTATNRGLADTARTNRSFRIWNVHGRPFHIRWKVEDSGWFAVVEPSGERRAIGRVHYP